MFSNPLFWEWIGRIAILAATITGVMGVVLGTRALTHQQKESERHTRGQAASVMILTGLLRRRFAEFWRKQLLVCTNRPVDATRESWWTEIGQDIGFAGKLQDAASEIDLKAVTLAVQTWERIFEMRSVLAQVQRAESNFEWKRDREFLLERVERVLETLDRLDKEFPDYARTVDGVDRDAFAFTLEHEIAEVGHSRSVQAISEYQKQLDAPKVGGQDS